VAVPAALGAGPVPWTPGVGDQPPVVSPLAPIADEAPPQPLGDEVAPGPLRGEATPAEAVPAVRSLFARGGGGATLTRAISDSRLMESPEARVRARAMTLTRGLGASVVRLQMSWRGALPGAPPRDAADPADPAYDWAPQDAAVRDAVAAGLTPVLVVAHAPPYAEAPHRWRYAAGGSWAPRPSELAAFATAVARRYSGAWPDPARPGGRTLPRVASFQAWNEPNLPRYLSPQWVVRDGRWVPWAPGHYRRMLNAFAAAVRAVQPSATIVSAGLAPNGESTDGAGRMTPIRFLRALLTKKADFDVLALHPLSVGDPDAPAGASLDVSVADATKVTAVLRAARLRRPLWVTELNWTARAIPPARRAAAVGRGLHRLWAGGARLVTWHFLEDPSGTAGRHAGLRTRGVRGPLSGKPKSYDRAFALPLDVLRRPGDRVAVWAVPRADGTLRVQTRRGPAGWHVARRVTSARRDRPLQLTIRAGAGTRVRVVSGGVASAALRVR
jgi:hypothetical protein